MSPTFASLSEDLLWKLENAHNNPQPFGRVTDLRRNIILDFFSSWQMTVGQDVYPAARLALPSKDRDRTFFIKDKTLGKYIIQISHIPEDSDDWKQINDWKSGFRDQLHSTKTLADILATIVAKRKLHHSTGGLLTIDEVNSRLDELNSGASAIHLKIIEEFIDKMNPKELRYIFKIILKQRVLGRMENQFFELWKPNGLRQFNVTNDLKQIFKNREIPDQDSAESMPSIQLMNPFAPQLSPFPPESYEKLANRLNNKFWIEEKLDGERIQIHMDLRTGNFKFFSRRGKDYSSIYGENGSVPGSVASCIIRNHVFVPGVNNCIIDGEMVAWDEERQQILPFGTLKGAALLQISEGAKGNESSSVHPFFIAFDLVYLNDKSYENYTLRSRRDHLATIIRNPVKSYFEVLDYYEGESGTDIGSALAQAVRKNSEGIVMKDPFSPYSVGTRAFSWIKVKPHYFEELTESLDLVVVGRSVSLKSTFVCALLKKEPEGAEGSLAQFVTLCNVANGLSRVDYEKISQETEKFWRRTDRKPPPTDLIDFGTVISDEWIDPRHSVVLEVRARSINTEIGLKFGAGTTLMNAYCKSVRSDKDWRTATTLDQYQQMRIPIATELENKKTTRRELPLTKKQLLHKKMRKGLDVEVEDSLFKGFVFHILSDYKSDSVRITKDSLYKLVRQHGADITYSHLDDLRKDIRYMVISQVMTRDTALGPVDHGYLVFRPQWIIDCINAKTIVPIENSHFFYGAAMGFPAKMLDEYGDSYYRGVSDDNLKEFFDHLKFPKSQPSIPSLAISQLMSSLLTGLSFYLISASSTCELTMELEDTIILHGGDVEKKYTDAKIIVVVDEYANKAEEADVIQKVERIRDALSNPIPDPGTAFKIFTRMVTYSYILLSIREGHLLPPEDYAFRPHA
ncbi:unnamed protein product [Kuraishia capsulata CBS 1993]|uniref:DNA ligase n=1 Tax=Kuraishia capsulata CBS 1993 TaxID=1382522 RepID=W6MHQ2_9ASCO|nr:uncharacterized protein KUCA_T00001486001 [Kuraishia capsulata CBS 1993]CDK25516.1 unnamed protein product [Kuraishia capsulata CBS 1993]